MVWLRLKFSRQPVDYSPHVHSPAILLVGAP